MAVPCGDLQSTAEKLVNGFTVVLFGQRAIAFETKTGEKRSPSAPEVENTVKGPKDAFTETVRTNTSLLRRHLRTPALRLYETVVGRRSLTNVTLAWIDGLTDPALVQRMQARLCLLYTSRLGAYCKFELIELPECRLPDDPNGTQIAAGLAREAEQIEAKLPRGAWFCVLTPEGTELSSEGLAERLQAEKLNGRSAACFLIGSSFRCV